MAVLGGTAVSYERSTPVNQVQAVGHARLADHRRGGGTFLLPSLFLSSLELSDTQVHKP